MPALLWAIPNIDLNKCLKESWLSSGTLIKMSKKNIEESSTEWTNVMIKDRITKQE